MTNHRPRTMDEKQKRDEALNLADFKVDDIMRVPADELQAETAEDFGDPAFLAEEFDAIARPVMSRHGGKVDQREAAPVVSLQPVPPVAPSLPAPAKPSPTPPRRFPRAAFAAPATWLAVPLRHRAFTGAIAALLLVVALAPGLYSRLADRPSAPIVAASKDDPPMGLPAPLPAPPAQPATAADPVSSDAANRGTAAPAAAPTAPPFAVARPTPAPPAPAGASDRSLPPPASLAARGAAPQATAAEPAAAPSAPAPLQREAAAKSRIADGNGFVVQLSAARSEAEAQSTFQALKSKYAVLEGREPIIRRKDQGKRASYAVQVGPFESQQAAEQLCRRVKNAGGNCFTTRN
jgi:cell division septation protein DedD